MVYACTRCERRFPRAKRCPRCSSLRVFDLTKTEDRDRVRRALDRVAIVRGRTLWLIGIGVAATGIASLVTGVPVGLIAIPALILVMLGTVMIVMFGAALSTNRVIETEARSTGRLPLLPFPPAALLPAPTTTVRGVVHLRRSVRSPDGFDCAAWRMVGHG